MTTADGDQDGVMLGLEDRDPHSPNADRCVRTGAFCVRSVTFLLPITLTSSCLGGCLPLSHPCWTRLHWFGVPGELMKGEGGKHSTSAFISESSQSSRTHVLNF